MNIRLAAEGDAAMLMHLNRAFNEVDEVPEQTVMNRLSSSGEIVAVAQDEGQLIGFCCAQVHHSFCYAFPSAEITEMFVEQGARRKGVGRALLAFMTAHLKDVHGVQEIHLLTGCENKAAKALYAVMGFEEKSETYMRKKLERNT